MSFNLRPDEIASLSEIEKSKGRENFQRKTVSSAIGTGLALAGAGKIMPFLSKHIPLDLAIKGISKVSPEIGNILKKGSEKGLNIQDGLDFLKKNFGFQKQPEQTNIIKQYSDELHAFLDDMIKKGRPVLEAGAIAQSNAKYRNIIKKLEKDHKANWSSILQSVYGTQEPSQSMQQPQQQMQGQSQPMQSGSNDQALLSAIERILKM